MKKIIALLIALAMCASCVLILASCGEPGASAYEIAVSYGFEGTEEEWLESLKGEKGDKGANGKDGEDGVEGDNGAPGAPGKSAYDLAKEYGLVPDGMSEEDWIKSLDGTDGKDGAINFENLKYTKGANGNLFINGYDTGVALDSIK